MTTSSITFRRAVTHTFRFEGGYVDDPADPGGATNRGISLRFLRAIGEIERWDHDGDGDLDAADVRALDRTDAEILYREHFWRDSYERLAPLVAIKLFDFGVNVGPRQCARFVQRAVNELDPGLLVVDGLLGARTVDALEKIAPDPSRTSIPNYGPNPAGRLLRDLEDHAGRFYFSLADRRRASRKYLFGWLRRCYARPELA